MGTQLNMNHFLALASLFTSTCIYAGNTDVPQVTGNITLQTNPTTTFGSVVFKNYTDDEYANKTDVIDYEIKNKDTESTDTDIKPSDEIIISSFDKLQTGHTVKENLESEHDFTVVKTKQTTHGTDKIISTVSGSTPILLSDSKTLSPVNIVETTTNKASSSTSERTLPTNDISTVNKQRESITPDRTYISPFPSSTALPVRQEHSSTGRTDKHLGHTVFKHHHIPFRHHLQLGLYCHLL